MNEVVSTILTILVILVSGGLLYWYGRSLKGGTKIELRPIKGYSSLDRQTGLAVETGRTLHVSPGRAGLGGVNSPSSIAALAVLDFLALEGARNNVPPLVTTGDGSLMVGAQDTVRGSYNRAERPNDFVPTAVRFQAAETQPMAFAAGTTIEQTSAALSGNVMVGRFGSEIAIMTETADRSSVEQILGTDDPMALAVMAAAADELLIGEEIFAASAYLRQETLSIAGLRVQDTLRIIACVSTLLAALVFLFA